MLIFSQHCKGFPALPYDRGLFRHTSVALRLSLIVQNLPSPLHSKIKSHRPPAKLCEIPCQDNG